MLLDGIEANAVDVVDGGGQSVGGHIVGRAGLELEGQALEGGTLPRHLVDHLAATLIGRQTVEPLLLAIEHTDTRRTVHLMAAEGQEIAVELLHVYGKVRCTLRTVDQHRDAVLVGDCG